MSTCELSLWLDAKFRHDSSFKFEELTPHIQGRRTKSAEAIIADLQRWSQHLEHEVWYFEVGWIDDAVLVRRRLGQLRDLGTPRLIQQVADSKEQQSGTVMAGIIPVDQSWCVTITHVPVSGMLMWDSHGPSGLRP